MIIQCNVCKDESQFNDMPQAFQLRCSCGGVKQKENICIIWGADDVLVESKPIPKVKLRVVKDV